MEKKWKQRRKRRQGNGRSSNKRLWWKKIMVSLTSILNVLLCLMFFFFLSFFLFLSHSTRNFELESLGLVQQTTSPSWTQKPLLWYIHYTQYAALACTGILWNINRAILCWKSSRETPVASVLWRPCGLHPPPDPQLPDAVPHLSFPG